MKYFAVWLNLGLAAAYAFASIFKHDTFYMAYAVLFMEIAHFVWDFISKEK